MTTYTTINIYDNYNLLTFFMFIMSSVIEFSWLKQRFSTGAPRHTGGPRSTPTWAKRSAIKNKQNDEGPKLEYQRVCRREKGENLECRKNFKKGHIPTIFKTMRFMLISVDTIILNKNQKFYSNRQCNEFILI